MKRMRSSPLLKLKWTNDKGMFWASVVGLLILAATLYYTRELLLSTSESSQRQLRAYLSISEGNLFDVAPGKAPRSVLRLSNSGQTPAYNITARGIVSFKKFEEMEDPVDVTKQKSFGTGLIGPGQYFGLTFHPDGALTQPEYDALLKGAFVIDVRAHVTYRDAFGKWHFVSYHGFYRHLPGEPVVEPLHFDQAREDNDAD